MQAGEAEGTLLTVPLTTPGGELRINARTAAGGSVTAEVCDASGQTLPGFEAQSCAPFQGDATDARLIWATAARIPASPDKGLSLRFHLRKADLYSFTIAEGW